MMVSSADWYALQGAISGEVILPGSPGYESARKPAIANFHGVRPQAVVSCETPEDVSGAISFARRFRLAATARSGGHCFAGRSSTSGIVIDVSPMNSVSGSDGVATVGAGARLGDVYDALDRHGLTIPAGCGPTVGISGLTLGGGLGILGRKHGLTADSLLEAQVVLADGRILECDEDHDGDLFWALRGTGGCGFGVASSLVFGTVPAPDATVFHLRWPHAHAAAVIEAWQTWSPAGPDDLAASLLVVAPGNTDRPPAVNLFGAMLATGSEVRDLLDEMVSRAGADPDSAYLNHMPYREAKRYLARLGDEMAGEDDQMGQTPNAEPPLEGHSYSKSEFFRQPLPREAVGALVENFSEDRVAGESRELDFTPWGGAYNRVPADATAFAHREEIFLLKHATTLEPRAPVARTEAARSWLTRSWATVRPWGSGRVYPNFPDPDLAEWALAYHGENLDRLGRVKGRYDPDGFFDFHQSVPSRLVK